MEKIDIHDSERNYEKSIKKLKKDVSRKNAGLIIKFLDDSAIGKTARKGVSRKQVGVRARLKNLFLLKLSIRLFKKDLDKLTVKDMERLIKALNNDTLRKQNRQKYSGQTKAYLKKTLIQFLRWLHGENEKFHELTDWIETRYKIKEITALSEEEICLLLKKCNTMKQKFLIAFLFDSGVRIEEFLNVRLEDIKEVTGEVPYYRVAVREEYSKTKGRTIGLFWKPTTDLISQWLDLHPDKNNPSALLYFSTYDGVRALLYKIGKRAINRKVNPHLFRHSSATYYAHRLNRYQLCKRYGWAFSSNMPDRYIDRAGIREDIIAEQFKQERMKDVMQEIEQLKENNRTLMESDKIFAKRLMVLLSAFMKNTKLAKQFLNTMSDEQKRVLLE